MMHDVSNNTALDLSAGQPGTAARPRDRAETARLILEAATAILAEDGFSAFGINAVARKAGCDKQLIYRYYGGLDGLIDAIGAGLARWVDDNLPEQGGGLLLTYGDLVERLMLLFLDALRADPLMRRIIAWELAEPHPRVRQLADARSKAMARWLDRVKGTMSAPKGIDAAAINALLIGAIQHVVLAAGTSGGQAGMALSTDKDWERVRGAIIRLVRGVFP